MSISEIAIGELSRRAGCNIETIRYYERIGLIPIPRRRGRYRRYVGSDVDRLKFIKRARELGFTLEEVSRLLELTVGEGESCAKARDIAACHLANIRRRIADLHRMQRVLNNTVQQCSAAKSHHCPIIEALVR